MKRCKANAAINRHYSMSIADAVRDHTSASVPRKPRRWMLVAVKPLWGFEHTSIRKYLYAKTYMLWYREPNAQSIVRLKLHYATDMGRCTVTLPSLGVVFTQSLAEVLVPACVVSFLVVLVHVNFVRILLQVCNIMGCMSALQDGIGCLWLLFALPQEMLAKADS